MIPFENNDITRKSLVDSRNKDIKQLREYFKGSFNWFQKLFLPNQLIKLLNTPKSTPDEIHQNAFHNIWFFQRWIFKGLRTFIQSPTQKIHAENPLAFEIFQAVINQDSEATVSPNSVIEQQAQSSSNEIFANHPHIQAQTQAQEQAQKQAQEQAQTQAQEQAQTQAQEQAQKQAQEQAQKQAQEQAQKQAQEQAQTQAQEQAQTQAQEQAQKQAQEQAQTQAQEQAQGQGSKTSSETAQISIRSNIQNENDAYELASSSNASVTTAIHTIATSKEFIKLVNDNYFQAIELVEQNSAFIVRLFKTSKEYIELTRVAYPIAIELLEKNSEYIAGLIKTSEDFIKLSEDAYLMAFKLIEQNGSIIVKLFDTPESFQKLNEVNQYLASMLSKKQSSFPISSTVINPLSSVHIVTPTDSSLTRKEVLHIEEVHTRAAITTYKELLSANKLDRQKALEQVVLFEGIDTKEITEVIKESFDDKEKWCSDQIKQQEQRLSETLANQTRTQAQKQEQKQGQAQVSNSNVQNRHDAHKIPSSSNESVTTIVNSEHLPGNDLSQMVGRGTLFSSAANAITVNKNGDHCIMPSV